MVNLRTEMERKRKKRIQMIETRKNAKIKECTLKHEKKYAEIKEYYQDITSTNLDIIKFLKEELQTSQAEEQTSQKEHTKHYRANKNVTQPLNKAKAEKYEFKKKQLIHLEIKAELDIVATEIKSIEGGYKEAEWEFEVKLQKIKYLEKER